MFFVRGKEASFPFYPVEVPADAGIVGIVDSLGYGSGAGERTSTLDLILARVTGTLVATQKNRSSKVRSCCSCSRSTLDDTPRGPELLAVDGVGAGVHEKVLIVLEGRAASDAIGQKMAPVDAAIIGIVDSVDLP